MACAERLLAPRPRIYPQFATHNALTVAAILERRRRHATATSSSACTAWARRSMPRLLADHPGVACRTYAPVGGHADLLAYLVRRLLENGANSSLRVGGRRSRRAGRDAAAAPGRSIIGRRRGRGNPRSAAAGRPAIAGRRKNSRGVEFGHRAALQALLAAVRQPAACRRGAGGRRTRRLAGRGPRPARDVRARSTARRSARVVERGRRSPTRPWRRRCRISRMAPHAGRNTRVRARTRCRPD